MGDLADIRYAADDRDLMEAEPGLAWIVVDEGDGIETETWISEELLGNHLAGSASAHDYRPHVVVAPTTVRVPLADAEEKTRGDYEGAGKKRVEGDDGDRNARRREAKEWKYQQTGQRGEDGDDRNTDDDPLYLGDAGIGPDAAVETAEYEDAECDWGGDRGKDDCGSRLGARRGEAVEAKDVG